MLRPIPDRFLNLLIFLDMVQSSLVQLDFIQCFNTVRRDLTPALRGWVVNVTDL